ncbi:pantetheine-phosphate adenylyltransferase family protein [Sporothrix brasiliensis 5110]|uniref:Pantetheine-phosphate adenylyltransferase family protein n=1 Tax=Sporothrix brasiliensis 5110 TaxID=1398154 RepID=A0A0C2IMJ7_9PEZI|nr:pantetheine-phosphate adenylyltransferase family protein [Sporothrix brasiliensis 5110]KIH90266.1 pantetheine-phosphate adenylyltransferase family protein [Sporothrix brasiliensis 5110]
MAHSNLPSLLLLPSPPEPASQAALGAAYRPPLEMALAKTKSAARATTLIVAVAFPFVGGPSQDSKRFAWPDAQSLLAGLYTIVAVLCEKLRIGTDVDGGPGSVDTRVVLLDHDRERRFPEYMPIIEPNNTVLVDLPSFASAYHPWNKIFYPQSEAGLHLSNQYLKFAQLVHKTTDDQVVPVDGGLTLRVGATTARTGTSSGLTSGTITPSHIIHIPTPLHKTVCLGGTFDYLHPGHKLLLTAGALLLDVPLPMSSGPCEYIIGVTGDELLKNKKFAEYVQPWDERARNVINFLATVLNLSRDGWEEKIGPEIDEKDGTFTATFRNESIVVQCVRIHDAFGPTVERQDITSLVVSGETRSGGRAVNEKRAARGWLPLETFVVDVLSADEAVAEMAAAADESASGREATAAAENFDSKISSTAIRQQRAEAAAAAAVIATTTAAAVVATAETTAQTAASQTA